MSKSKSIPDRWIPYKACGKVIEGTRIICFKVPLKKSVQVGRDSITEIWDIDTLLAKQPRMGGVIDLTNTSRYYNPADLQSAGVLHKKILMPGRVIPPEDKVREFMDTIDEFLGKDCEMLIGVHCTHGLNRTGYMVCRYMRDRLGIDAQDAITRFEEARGYKIERENYVADILGKKPPPPDTGKSTVVRPIQNRNNMEYRSPLNQYHDDDDRQESSRSRYDYNWRTGDRRGDESSRRKRSDSYDFRHDY